MNLKSVERVYLQFYGINQYSGQSFSHSFVIFPFFFQQFIYVDDPQLYQEDRIQYAIDKFVARG